MRQSSSPVVATTVLAICLLLAPEGASANEMGQIFSPEGLYLPAGLNLGLSAHEGYSFHLGSEVSLVHLDGDTLFYYGAYVDGLWDFGPDEFRFSIGPEIGGAFLGLDMGYLGVATGAGDFYNGLSLRAFFSVIMAHAYVRFGMLFDSPGKNDGFVEVGILIKLPIMLDD